MRILITGAGEVGFLIANELSKDHDVTVIDKDPGACSHLMDMDLKVLEGNSANLRLLQKAGIKNADLVVAVTGNDEVNVITCIIANHVGVRQTIARVSNPDYVEKPIQNRKEIGIGDIVCPEMVMAEDLARSIFIPSMLMNRDFANGLVELIEFKVTNDVNIPGPFQNISLPKSCKVVAINRAGEIFMPKNEDVVMINDRLMLLCDSKVLPSLKQMIPESQNSPKVMIVGGGKVGFHLANIMETMGAEIRLIEQSAERCSKIADRLTHTMILNGDGSDLALLREEDAGKMDVVFAVTGKDDKNLLCSLLVKQLGAKKVLSRVNRNAYSRLFEMVGVDRAVSPGQVTADAVLQKVIGGEEVITLSDERVKLVSYMVRPGQKIIGKNISRELPEDSMAGMVIRDGIPLVPSDDFEAAIGDHIFVVSMPDVVTEVKKLFAS